MERKTILLYNSLTGDNVDNLDCIIALKESLKPRGYASKDELKSMICDWIDFNIENGLE